MSARRLRDGLREYPLNQLRTRGGNAPKDGYIIIGGNGFCSRQAAIARHCKQSRKPRRYQNLIVYLGERAMASETVVVPLGRAHS